MRSLRSLGILALCLLAVPAVRAQIPRPCKAPATVPDPAPALNYPDHFVWKLFVEVNAKPASQTTLKTSDGKSVTTNDALWETWADDPWTFPASPDPAHPPVWPGTVRPGKRLVKPFRGTVHVPDSVLITVGGTEEVRRNRSTFDFVVNNGLWYTQGIAAFFGGGKIVDFPLDSIEVKGNWVPIQESDKPHYHWNYDASGKLYGLVAMHITSKALPNWIWATFEWVGNAGRCDFIGCRDCFGYTPSIVPSQTKTAGTVYPGGAITKPLAAMFQEGGLTGEWGAEWLNYRLKGSQTDFTDSSGVPLQVGNSVTEGGFVQTASCMTCHSRAAVNAAGQNVFPIFGEKEPLPLQTLSPLEYQTQYTTYNGPPDPNWFWLFTGQETKKVNMQVDFVWAIPFRAQPAKK
jgi:hypothetical protein